MHTIEPFYSWRDYYIAAEDKHSPLYGREYSEFMFTNTIYNYYIHPQWDWFGSNTLYLKILFTDYDQGFTIIELIGEWNDCINNDIMLLKNNIINWLLRCGIYRYILIGENILNLHCTDDCYYEEWFEEVIEEGGWIAAVNFREHVIEEMRNNNLEQFISFGGRLNQLHWRKLKPNTFYEMMDGMIIKALY